MNSNLVHPACVRLCFEQRETGGCRVRGCETAKRAKGSSRGTTLGMDALFKPYPRGVVQPLSQQRRLNLPSVLERPAKDQRRVGLANLARLHLATQVARRRFCFCDQCEAAGFSVQPIDDGNCSAIDTFKSKEIQQVMPKCALIPRLAWVHLHECRLFNHQPFGKFLYHKRKVARNRARGSDVRHCKVAW